ncbi:MAG: NADH dehydrogenase [ubiquinone] 1 alpha subcomplex assembly factor 5 [Alphaproteobacteria bacterium]|jgi:NADH dehydrogenase [ubiquinone] 1 alpha subcomplex assembly factor 5
MTQKKTISIQIEEETPLFPPFAVQNSYKKAAPNYNAHSAITVEIAKRLADRLHDSKHTFDKIVDLGAGTGALEKIIMAELKPSLFVSADFSKPMLEQANGHKILLNAEDELPFKNQTFDLVISNLMLPWVNDVAKCLHMSGKVLKEDGLLLASTLGVESFKEFRYAFEKAGLGGNHIIPLPDIQSVGDVLQRRGFALPVIDRDIITLSYPSFKAIYSDIQNLGAKNLNPQRRSTPIGKEAWAKMEEIYRKNFSLEDGSLSLTLEVIYLHGWRPHESQPKALKPGSAQTSLAKALI